MRGGERNGDVRMRGENGELVRGESELKGVWKGYLNRKMWKSRRCGWNNCRNVEV